MTSRQRSLFYLGALLALATTQACGSDTSDNGAAAGSPHAGSGASGAPAGGASGSAQAGAVGVSGGGSPSSAGASGSTAGSGSSGLSGGSGSANGGSGGSTGGLGGAGSGSGGSIGGSGGSSGATAGSSGSSGGGSAVSFTQVATLLSQTCAGATCHSAGAEVNLTNMTGLHSRLTMPLANSVGHCKGTTLAVANNPSGSFLVSILKAGGSCMNNGQSQSIGHMPDNCPGQRACLTTAQIQLVSNWIASGAPSM